MDIISVKRVVFFVGCVSWLVSLEGVRAADETHAFASEVVVDWPGLTSNETEGVTQEGVLNRPYDDKYGAKVGVLVYSICDQPLEFPIVDNPIQSEKCVFTCTAFLVSDFHVLTLRSCVEDREDMIYLPAISDRVWPMSIEGYGLSSEKPYGVAKVVGQRFPDSSADMALLTLDRKVGAWTGHFTVARKSLAVDEPLATFGYPAGGKFCTDRTGDLQWYRPFSLKAVSNTVFESDVVACTGESGAPAITADGMVTGILVSPSKIGGCTTCRSPNRFHRFSASDVAFVERNICADDCRCSTGSNSEGKDCRNPPDLPDVWDTKRYNSTVYPQEVRAVDENGVYLGGPARIAMTVMNIGTAESSNISIEFFLSKEDDIQAAYEGRVNLTNLGTFTTSQNIPAGKLLVVSADIAIPDEGVTDKLTTEWSFYALIRESKAGPSRDAILRWSYLSNVIIRGGPGIDECPQNAQLWKRGKCGCEMPDIDSDNDGVLDCHDRCPFNPNMVFPGICGCEDTTDCENPDYCPRDNGVKTEPGVCGCDVPDVDSDEDGVLDCLDGCPLHRIKTEPGVCGCADPDEDLDGDGVIDCLGYQRNPESSDIISGANCFPAGALLDVRGRGYLPVEQINIGDSVKTAGGDFSDVFFFGHRDPSVQCRFVQLTVAPGLSLTLSPSHYIPSNGKLVAAGEVSIGDLVLLANGTQAPVQSVAYVSKRGLYNPHTIVGNVVVDGVVASCFTAALPPSLATIFLIPLQLLYLVGLKGVTGQLFDRDTPEIIVFLLRLFRTSQLFQN